MAPMNGPIKRLVTDKGFGFILAADGNEYFFHSSACAQTRFDDLREGQAVTSSHLRPTYEALGRRALDAPVINVDETRWAIMGSAHATTGTVWGVRAPTVAFYRILPGKSVDEGRYRRSCLSFRYSVAAPMPSRCAALARLPPDARLRSKRRRVLTRTHPMPE